MGRGDNMIDTRLESKLGFDRIRTMISDRCSTEYATARVAGERFCSDPKVIGKRLALTDEMRLVVMFEENFPVNGYIDCIDFLKPLAREGCTIDQVSLGKLRTLAETVRRLTDFFAATKDGVYPNLKRMSSKVVCFPEIQRKIDTILDKFGDFKDTASDELFRIRKTIKTKESAISKVAANILREAQASGIAGEDAAITIRDGKLLIPVNSSSKRKIPGFVHDTSATGKTSFIEPAELIEIDNEIANLRVEEAQEIHRILSDFSDFVRPHIPDLLFASEYVGETDFLVAKAQVSLDFKAGMPVISKDGEMNLRKARHPLLEKALARESKQIVPVSVKLNPAKHILLISGPNAGGKSVCLKTTGLLQYMFQWGMLIPTSESSELPVFDRIMVSIGDDQNIENDLSTYSSFLEDMKSMLREADSRTLVLIDEFGSGTEPAAGGAIAEAILSELDRKGVYGVITTHYTNLKLYASGPQTGVINGAMQFDAARIQPLFALEIGLPGNSFAFELARKMGLPENIVKDAENRAGEEFVNIERNLRKIVRNRKALEDKLQKIKNTDKTLESITERYQKELEDIQQTKKEILDKANQEARDIVKGANRTVENTIRTIKEAQAEKEKTMGARKSLQDFMSALQARKEQEKKDHDSYLDNKLRQLEERKKRSLARKGKNVEKQAENATQEFRGGALKVGEKVRVKSNGMAGEVVRVSDKAVTIAIGNITSKMPLDKVERISSNEYKAAMKKESASRPVGTTPDNSGLRERRLRFSPELDIRGERVTDALNIVEHFIDDAVMLNIGTVRIIHGKGTGALRDEIQKYLNSVPGIASVKDEHIQFGGSGVTIVTFE
ncbi:MAG: Smr/MutS family protein [Bacteroidales bacterium]|uniref:endonuclease MutS2 n=1 Tax=Candidatus Cryptobacteroides sp. TaxID=2952915 RepID=UPI002A819729|nr:Smr/MutS family protein [Candidatus Cryptobacteroides sp.]MDD7134903.1 Smr/MutS family protein [Bacteroidales bacterium]MDY3879095.1 Smr/MutS family protein [Candidatus Cryptobacteroides sp.]MDY5042623.1 Smr/MutS family protein [Candidatus Cryptobacteroides sp.]